MSRTRSKTYGHALIEIKPPEGSRVGVISPNWCDCTTWHETAVEAADEALVDSGNGVLFNSANTCWIDTTHGKLTGENKLDAKFIPIIKVDGATMSENAPFGGAVADYSINYATGDVTFTVSQAGKAVTATYWRQNGSLWTIKPADGKVLRLTTVEVQFSKNIELKDTVTFQAYGFVEAFAPELLDTATPPGPYPAGTHIPIGSPTTYKTMMDYVNDASGAYPEIPAMGGAIRGHTQPIQIFQWPYDQRAATDLRASAGMEIRIKLDNDIVFVGEHAIATFYGISEDE